MRIELREGSDEILIVTRDQVIEFHDEGSALAFLRRLSNDPEKMSTLRQTLLEAGPVTGDFGFDDDATLNQMAAELVRGDYRIIIRPEALWPVISWQEAQSSAGYAEGEYTVVRPEPEPTEVASTPAPPPPPPPVITDEPAQAECLEEAAQSGAPLVEEAEQPQQGQSGQSSAPAASAT